jgi:hypothetical protein
MSAVPQKTGVAVVLVDGPAAGHYETAFEEPPETLQAVSSVDGDAALLDEPGDLPLLGERVHTYYLDGGPAWICTRSGANRGCGVHFNYRLLEPEPDSDHYPGGAHE